MRSRRLWVLTVAAVLALAGCGSSPGRSAAVPSGAAQTSALSTPTIPAALLNEMRPVGVGPRFRVAVTGRPTGGCAPTPGRLEAHIELFAANRVLLIPSGVGHAGRCYGNAVTTDPTGAVHFRLGATLADVFRAWGQPLSPTQIASFHGSVRYYVAGARVRHLPALTQHAEIVLEVGPYVPPHRSYSFPRGL